MRTSYRYVRSILLLLTFCLHFAVNGQPINVQDLAVLVDPDGTQTISSVSAPEAQVHFRRLDAVLSAGYTRKVHWLRFTVQMPSAGLPYSIFYLAALIPWTCFSNGLAQAAGSMEGSAGLISKVYFPRLIVPSAMVLGTVVDFSIGWVMFNALAIYRGFWTWWFIPFTPLLLALQLGTAMGIGLVLAALNAQYRDIRYVTPFLIQVGMLATPVIYPLERLLATRFTRLLGVFVYLNPMVGVIETYRALCFSAAYVPWKLLAGNFATAGVLFTFGVWFFRRREQKIVDLL